MTSKSACGCQQPAAPQEGEDVVWHDPTRYDPVVHGPPYMPARLAHDAKAVARKVASANVHPKAARRLMGSAAPLSAVLTILRAASFLHQTHHWQTEGPSYYADHLLFDRLYKDGQDYIDQVAEKAVGMGSAQLVNPLNQVRQLSQVIEVVAGQVDTPEQMIEASLRMESLVLSVIDEAIDVLSNSDSLTAGIDNLLQGVADLHETFVYLLKQRASDSYDYAR